MIAAEHRGRGEDAGGEPLQLGELAERDRGDDEEDVSDEQAAQEAQPGLGRARDL